MLDEYENLRKENATLHEQLLKAENGEASRKKLEALKEELLAKEEEIAASKIQLAKADEKIEGLNAQLADAGSVEERLRLRIQLLLSQLGEHVQQSINQQPRLQQPPQQPPAPQTSLPDVEAEPSAPELPCDNATETYTSSSSGSSESECEGPLLPAPPEL